MSRSRTTVVVLPLAVVLTLALASAEARAQGSIKGRVTDRSGAVLPGTDVVASNATARQKVVTGASGLYQLNDLPDGTYTVTASLLGFVTATREGVTVVSGQTTDQVDFSLCVGGLLFIDWVTWPSLEEAWKNAEVVAYIRIEGNGSPPSDCPHNDFVHTVAVLETFKGAAAGDAARTLTFRQENWAEERTPYRIGQKMIVFLIRSGNELHRLSGPFYVFFVNGNEISSFHSPVKTDGMTADDFMARLRALAQKRRPVP